MRRNCLNYWRNDELKVIPEANNHITIEMENGTVVDILEDTYNESLRILKYNKNRKLKRVLVL
jgi:hypothetical protein